jgi:hypothetical protein
LARLAEFAALASLAEVSATIAPTTLVVKSDILSDLTSLNGPAKVESEVTPAA